MNGIVVSPLPPKPVHINSQCDSLCPSPLYFPLKNTDVISSGNESKDDT